ncbi:cystathionine gamma-lyase-like [Chironomus tepperi]|uniref:cystathionine gamma-lyase-like n=1 Tax=Chironomus tepperi TaxID=113505 RepID=UPI00391F8AFF
MEDLPISLGEKLGFLKQPKGFATKAIHAGQESDQWNSGAVVPPIVTSTTFVQKTPGEHTGFRYSRYGNPSRTSLDACLAALDDAKYAIAFTAGVSSLTAIMATFESGDNLISSKKFFAGDFIIWDTFKKLGVETKYIDFSDLGNLTEALDEKTRMVWIESPMNPSLTVLDIKAIADIVHSKSKAFLVVDNTFLTPYFQRPLELGADIVAYSISKFIGGHSDIVGGSISTNNQELYEKIKASQIALGVTPSPFTCYLINRSLRTLSVRMEKHFENSYAVAKYLESHPKIEKVNHPALKSHQGFEIATKQSYGHSGILSFYIKNGTLEMSKTFFKSLKLVIVGESLGGTETLASFPWVMSHSTMPEDERIKAGVTESLIRISIGLEDVRDVIEDLGNALEAI